MVIFATGNVTHDYYQVITLPIISIFTALGIEALLFTKTKLFSKPLSMGLGISAIVLGLSFSWFHVRDYFNINNPAIVEAGIAVDRWVPPEAKVIAPYMGDTAFLYQTNRQGWPIGTVIPERIAMGATHYVSTTYDDESRALEASCQLLEKTDQYIIISLENCNFDQQ